MEKWWNEICGRGKWEKPVKNLPRPRFIHHETHMEGPRRELGTPVVRGERLTACATRPPPVRLVNFNLKIFNLGARRGGDVHFPIARLYITVLD